MDECTLNDLLECSVCLERLDTSSKVLPCQHTFCKKCLEEIVNTHRELRCPECRVLVDAKVDDLPPNVLLMRILEGMRNAAPKSTKSVVKSNPGSQRLFGGHQITSTTSATTNPAPNAFNSEPIRHASSTAKQAQLHTQTYCRAIYDYVSNISGDLSFKKGDIVIPRKKIDNNWYFGESANSRGVFPLSYVQVVTPITPHVPQCKALYDFRMTNDDEDGCLTFNKGEVIIVFRRVDENWAEGKLSDRIGIFPLAFVELNSVARALMKLSTNTQPGPSRVAPPTPTNEETIPLIPTDHSHNVQPNVRRPVLLGQNEDPPCLIPTDHSHNEDPNVRRPVLLGQHRALPCSVPTDHSHNEDPNVRRPALQGQHRALPCSKPTDHSHNEDPNVRRPVLLGQHRVLPCSVPTDHSHNEDPNVRRPVLLGQHRALPCSVPTDHSHNDDLNVRRPVLLGPSMALPVSDSISTVSSGGSSSTTTSNTPNSSTTSSSSSTAPSSPSSPATSPPAVGNRHSVKRHSFTAINTGHQTHPHHRHSAEILSPPVDNAVGSSNNSCSNDSFSPLHTSSSAADHHLRHRRSGSSDLTLAQTSQNLPTSTSGNANLPAAYIALYPYKPQKADELELRKGGIYMVTERCQDGWFKGTSNRTQKCGVFPGNYVAPSRYYRNVCRGSPSTGQNQNVSPSTNQNCTESQRATVTYTKSKGLAPQPYSPRTLLPPELPPRAISPSSVVSSSWHGQSQTQNQENSPPRCNEQNPGNPLGRSHSAVMSSSISSPGKQTILSQSLTATTTVAGISNSGTTATATASSITSEINKSPNNTLRTIASPSSTASVAATKNTEKQKERKDKCVSLMRRLTNIKKSKSPPPTTYSMDNPVFDDGNSINPVHIRSGSCPSQLLQVGATQELNASNNHHRLCPGTVQGHVTSSQRLKYKERPSLSVSIFQRSNESGGMACTPVGNHHRKSNSLDAGMGKQIKQQSSRERERVYRFRCIVPYPPNSEFELELRVGDIIYVHKKRDDGWYKGTQQRTGRTGLFPASFVEAF